MVAINGYADFEITIKKKYEMKKLTLSLMLGMGLASQIQELKAQKSLALNFNGPSENLVGGREDRKSI